MSAPTAKEIKWLATNYDQHGTEFATWLLGSKTALDIMGRLIEDGNKAKEEIQHLEDEILDCPAESYHQGGQTK